MSFRTTSGFGVITVQVHWESPAKFTLYLAIDGGFCKETAKLDFLSALFRLFSNNNNELFMIRKMTTRDYFLPLRELYYS